MKLNSLNYQNLVLICFYLIPLELISGPLITEVLIVLFLIYGSIEYIKNKQVIKSFQKYINILFFYLILIISSLTNDNSFLSKLEIFPYFRFILFVIGGFLLIKKNNEFEKKLTVIFFIIFLVLFFDSIYQFLLKKNILNFPVIEKGRISSLFGDELILGSFIVRFFPIFLSLYFYKKNTTRIDVKIILIFVSSFALILLSGERTALYLFSLQIFLFLIFIKGFKFEKYFLIFLFSVFLVIILVTKNIIKERIFNHTLNSIYFDGNIKIELTDQYKIFGDFITVYKNQNKLIGVGPKKFEVSCDEYKNSTKIEDKCANHPHNSYLQILNETGFIGLFIILFVLIYFVRDLIILCIKRGIQKNFNSQFCLIIAILTTLFPVTQTADFFNNWISIVYFFPIPIYLKYKQYS